MITLLFILHAKLLVFALICIKLWRSDSLRISMTLNFLIDWNRVTTHNNPNEMWDFWKHLLARVLLISMYHSEQKGLKTNVLPGLLMNCYVKYIKEIFKKRKLHLQMTHWFGNSLKMQEIRPITQWKKLNVKINFFFENLDANKSDPRKTGQLINELKSRKSKSTKVPQVKTGNQVLIQLTLVLISLKHLTIILQLNIGHCYIPRLSLN